MTTQLTEKDAAWVYRFTGGAVTHNAAVKDPNSVGAPFPSDKDRLRAANDKESLDHQKLRDQLLAQTLSEVNGTAEKLRGKLLVTIKRSNGKEQKSRADSGDQADATAFDVGAATGDVKAMMFGEGDKMRSTKPETEKELQELGAAKKEFEEGVLSLQSYGDRLAAVQVERTIGFTNGTPTKESVNLFTEEGIATAVFEPLHRDAVLGDTMVLGKWSKTQQMLDASDQYYIKDCKKKGRRADRGVATALKSTVSMAADLTTAVLGAQAKPSSGQTGVNASNWTKDQVDQYSDITAGAAALLSVGIDAGDAVADGVIRGDFSEKSFDAMFVSIGQGLGSIFAGLTLNEDLAGQIAISFNGAMVAKKAGVTIKTWASRSPIKWDQFPLKEMLGSLAESLATALNMASDSLPDANQDNVCGILGDTLPEAIKGLISLKEDFIGAIEKGDWSGAICYLQSEINAAVAKTINATETFPTFNDISGASDAYSGQYNANLAQTKVDTGAGKVDDGFKKLMSRLSAKLNEETEDKTKQRLQETIDKMKAMEDAKKKLVQESDQEKWDRMQEELTAEIDQFKKDLVSLDASSPDDAELKSISQLIEKLEHDRALWDGLSGFLGGGISMAQGAESLLTSVNTSDVVSSVAAAATPLLKEAGNLVKFVTNVRLAVERRSAWLQWEENNIDSMSAQSPYATAIQNFAANQHGQYGQYACQAALNFAQACLDIGGLTPVAPITKLASSAVGATAALEAALWKFANQQKLAMAWKETKAAFDPANKGDRKLRLLVRKLNPTLAKYSLCYGAMIAKDPIAARAMSSIGIDREVLKNEGDGVKKVVDYLAQLYPDDGSVWITADVVETKTPIPKPEISTKVWALTASILKDECGIDVPAEILANMALIEKFNAELEAAKAGGNASRTRRVKKRSGRSGKPKADPDGAKAALIGAYDGLTNALEGFVPARKDGASREKDDTISSLVDEYADLSRTEKTAVTNLNLS